VVEHRDRLMRFGLEYVDAGSEITDDIVRDLQEVWCSCAPGRTARSMTGGLTGQKICAAMLQIGRVAPEPTPVKRKAHAGLRASVKPASLKQESAMSYMGMD
jgi:hypothetical protein